MPEILQVLATTLIGNTQRGKPMPSAVPVLPSLSPLNEETLTLEQTYMLDCFLPENKLFPRDLRGSSCDAGPAGLAVTNVRDLRGLV